MTCWLIWPSFERMSKSTCFFSLTIHENWEYKRWQHTDRQTDSGYHTITVSYCGEGKEITGMYQQVITQQIQHYHAKKFPGEANVQKCMLGYHLWSCRFLTVYLSTLANHQVNSDNIDNDDHQLFKYSFISYSTFNVRCMDYSF